MSASSSLYQGDLIPVSHAIASHPGAAMLTERPISLPESAFPIPSLTKRIAASGNEIAERPEAERTHEQCHPLSFGTVLIRFSRDVFAAVAVVVA